MNLKGSPKAREIYRVDLTGAVQDRGWNATHRICVVVEVFPDDSMTVIFGAWDHAERKCCCIEPGTPMAKAFGDWLTKTTHFSCWNVASAPFDRIIEHMGEVSRDDFDRFDEVVTYAELFSLKKATT